METSGIGLFFQEGGVAVIILTTKLARDDFYSQPDFFGWLIFSRASVIHTRRHTLPLS